ncbi:hypothetical protein GCK32_019673 [Trichostrongylus colubriformis]|uniref:Uncharacterized protein n=1 Tax=Trichostrongylus colubriformis TaxID=6319 RepID=A0AAN8FKW9_TRICO
MPCEASCGIVCEIFHTGWNNTFLVLLIYFTIVVHYLFFAGIYSFSMAHLLTTVHSLDTRFRQLLRQRVSKMLVEAVLQTSCIYLGVQPNFYPTNHLRIFGLLCSALVRITSHGQVVSPLHKGTVSKRTGYHWSDTLDSKKLPRFYL